MQRQLRLGFFTTVALGLSACSEDPDGRRFLPNDVTALAGSGGVAGAGGGSSAGGGISGGSGGGAGQGPVTFPPPPCTGCIEMDVPLDPAFRDATGAQNLAAMYNFVFPATGLDMSNATVTWSISTLTPGSDLYVTPYAQNAQDLNYAGVYRPETALTAANGFNAAGSPFVDVVLDLANTAPFGAGASAAQDAGSDAGDAGTPAGAGTLDNGGMDKSRVWQLGIRIGAQTTLAAPTTIRLLVDKVTFTGVDGANTMLRTRDFSTGPEELVVNTYMLPPGSTGPTKY
jgi:hypothetical protein